MDSTQQQAETTTAKKEWQAPELNTISKKDVQGGSGQNYDGHSAAS
ncbi:hypothetical protein [Mucilaginibacter paludis]|uniref:Uncharacterized protein n=1 Tax=Mucilaginibacter paludis DSM 18603 TaxID=714943 RepID=H1Y2B2_9SPHI|nr:hypothetical protein [Mucilaginibacter paludis]EHQ27892.1 hypothetical protein Mucpa_3794 [Mucilaginibacter paludis DSM 18603]